MADVPLERGYVLRPHRIAQVHRVVRRTAEELLEVRQLETGYRPLVDERAAGITLVGGDHSLDGGSSYSHSIVPGGFEVRSRATRFTPGISLMIRLETVSSKS